MVTEHGNYLIFFKFGVTKRTFNFSVHGENEGVQVHAKIREMCLKCENNILKCII